MSVCVVCASVCALASTLCTFNSFNNFLLSICYMPGIVLGAGD